MNVCALLGRLALWICLAGTFGAASAQIYTWTDADGKKHFGDAAMRPKDKAISEVKIPPANVSERFEARKESELPHVPEPQSEAVPPAPTVPYGASTPLPMPRKISSVERDQDTCRAQWEAYDAGAACYAECGKNIACPSPGFFLTCGRNNAECGHCSDAPMPRC